MAKLWGDGVELTFEYIQKITDGHNPAAFHNPDNIMQVFYVDDEGRMRAVEGEIPSGDFGDVEFFGEHLAAPDSAVEFLKITYLPRMNLFATWKAADQHRKAVFLLKQEINKYFCDGQISIKKDSPVMQLSLTLENPEGIISKEDETESEAFPGSKITIYFRIGDSSRYPLGVYYIDRISTKTGDSKVTLDARSLSGKLLVDQSFDEDNIYPPDNLHTNIERILKNAGISSFRIQPSGDIAGMEFPPNMSVFDGLCEYLTLTNGWIMRELVTGVIVFGEPGFAGFDKAGAYNFSRGQDCFCREIHRDDMETYSRVCVHTRDFTVKAYRDIAFREHWNLARKKTLYVEMSEDSTQADADKYADVMAGRLSKTGVVETFIGPIRPHLQPGDAADIQELGKLSRRLGVVTEVTHRFGVSGFTTQFVVDSGGELRKMTIKDLINKIAGQKMNSAKKL